MLEIGIAMLVDYAYNHADISKAEGEAAKLESDPVIAKAESKMEQEVKSYGPSIGFGQEGGQE